MPLLRKGGGLCRGYPIPDSSVWGVPGALTGRTHADEGLPTGCGHWPEEGCPGGVSHNPNAGAFK